MLRAAMSSLRFRIAEDAGNFAILPFMERMGIALWRSPARKSSTLAKNSAVALDVSVAEEASPRDFATRARPRRLQWGDALAVALLEKRGFKEQDFAQFHPGGRSDVVCW